MNRTKGFAAVAVLALVGCNDGPRQVAGPGFGDATAIFTVVSVAPTQFKVGETANVTVRAHNPTSEPITLHFSSGCLVGFAVRAQDGTIVAPTGIVCTANTPTVVLGPGEDIEDTFRWDGRASFGYGPGLTPGVYQVTGQLNATESHATSPPVMVTILS